MSGKRYILKGNDFIGRHTVYSYGASLGSGKLKVGGDAKKYLEKYDVSVISYTNQKYNEGLNLDILSIESDSNIFEPTIKETVEPTVMCKGQIIKKAKVILLKN